MKVRLIDICQPKQWQTISTDRLLQYGYPVYGANGVIGYYDKYNHANPTVMITCRGATCGTINISEPFSYINGNAMCLDNLSKDVLIKYLYYQLVNYDFNQVISGSAQPQITREGLGKVWLSIHSLDEQKTIADNLKKIENVIEKRKLQLEKLDLFVKSKFSEMFGDMQKNVAVSTVANVAGGFSFKSQDIVDNGVRLLQISNVALNDVSWEVSNYLPRSYLGKYSTFSLQKNDIIMALTRPIIQSLGNVKTCIIKDVDIPSLLNQRVARIKAINCNYIFLFYCFMTDAFTQYVIDSCSGCSQPNMSTKAIEKYMIPKADVTLQNEFAAFVEQTDSVKLSIKHSLNKLETLKKALMQKYFG